MHTISFSKNILEVDNYTIMLLDKIDDLLKEVSQLSAKNAEDVEKLRIKYLSKKGEISELMDEFQRTRRRSSE